MTDKLKKFQPFGRIVALVLVVALLVGSAPSAFAARAPRDPETKQALDIMHVGAKACRVNASTTASKCSVAGSSGMLYALCAFGTTAVAGKGVMAFDSASASGITMLDVADAFVAAYAISPVVLGSALVQMSGTYLPDSVNGCWVPKVPVRYESGFVMKLNDASLMAIGLVRPDTGVNP